MSNKSPCGDCPNVGCGVYHAECEKYLNYVRENERIKEIKRNEREIYDYKAEELTKKMHREHRKGKYRCNAFK